jgi:hypothetical protein
MKETGHVVNPEVSPFSAVRSRRGGAGIILTPGRDEAVA